MQSLLLIMLSVLLSFSVKGQEPEPPPPPDAAAAPSNEPAPPPDQGAAEPAAPDGGQPAEPPAPAAPSEPAPPAGEPAPPAGEPAPPAGPPPPPAPEPPAPKPEKIEIVGIDTVDISEPKGNWLYKRIWWERAERLYEKIKQLVSTISEARMVFFERRTELDRKVLDPFYLGVGLNQGELTQILTYYVAELDKEKAAHVTLTPSERAFLLMLENEKKSLEQLQSGVQLVMKVEQAIDASLAKLMEQINLSNGYEKKSWDSFKAINRELSDKKAQEYYYTMESYWKNINNIDSYIAKDFTQYFDDLIKRIYKATEMIKQEVKTLKEKGINITDQGQQLAQHGVVKIETKVTEEKSEEPAVEKTWYSTIVNYIKTPFVAMYHGIKAGISWLGSWFGKGSAAEPIAEEHASEPVKPKDEPKKVSVAEPWQIHDTRNKLDMVVAEHLEQV